MRDGTGLTPGREIMKRLFAIIAPLLILLGCDGKKGGPDPVDIEWGAGRQLAVAFLGYYDSEAAFRHSDYYAGLANCYPWLAEAAEAGTPDGMALCLVIPRYESSELTVSQYVPAGTKKEKGVKYDKVYATVSGKPFILRCNLLAPDVVISCKDSTGAEFSYVPAIVGDGRMFVSDSKKMVDISLPLPETDPFLKNASYTDGFGISASVRSGLPFLHVDLHSLLGMGVVWDESDLNISDGDNPVRGLNGICKGVFIGDIGQDYNPVLCALMTDDKVKILSVFGSLHSGEGTLSSAIEGIGDIVGFECGGAGKMDDGGYSYNTIYAIDRRGRSHEIPLFLGRADEYYSVFGDGSMLNVSLSQDWHISARWTGPDGRAGRRLEGTFQEMSTSDSCRVFAYRTDDSAGTFKVRYTEEFTDLLVSADGAVSLADTTYFHPGAGPEDDIEYD